MPVSFTSKWEWTYSSRPGCVPEDGLGVVVEVGIGIGPRDRRERPGAHAAERREESAPYFMRFRRVEQA